MAWNTVVGVPSRTSAPEAQVHVNQQAIPHRYVPLVPIGWRRAAIGTAAIKSNPQGRLNTYTAA